MSGSRNIVLSLSTRGAEKVRADLEALGPAGEAALKRLDDAVRRAGAGMGTASHGTDDLRQRLSGLGLQLQDVAVQAQMGTSALTILGQQGPQIASVFGPAGAIAGAGIAVAAFAGQLTIAALNGKQLDDVFKQIDASSRLADDAAKRRVQGLEEEAERLNRLAAAYREYSAAALSGERARLTRERDDLEKAVRARVSDLDSGTFGLGSIRTAAAGALASGNEGPTSVEQGALARLDELNNAAEITRTKILEIIGQFDAAAQAGGPFASSMERIARALQDQIGPLTESGEKARQNAANLALISEASGPAATGVAGVGTAANRTEGQVGGLNSALDGTRQRLLALAQARVANPFEDVQESLNRIQAQRAALERGGTEAFAQEQRRQTAQAQIASRVEQDVAKLEKALKDANVSGAEAERRLAEARTEAVRLRTEEANGQAQLMNDVEARRKAEADARREATAGRTAARKEEREAAAERQAALRVEAELYEKAVQTRSGLLSIGTMDDRVIREIQGRMRGGIFDPEVAEKQKKEFERAYEQQQRVAERTYDRIVDYAGDTFADMMTSQERSWEQTWRNLQKTAVATLAKIAFEAAARPVIMPVVQSVMGVVGGSAGTSSGRMAGGGNQSAVTAMGSEYARYSSYLEQGSAMSKLGSGIFDTGPGMLDPGYNFSGGMIGRFDTLAQTNVGGFLNQPLYSTGLGTSLNAGVANNLAANGFTYVGDASMGAVGTSTVAGTNGTVSVGGAALGAVGVVGGLYGIYSGIQQGGAKGAANVISGAAGATSGGLALAGVGAGSAGILGAVATVAPYVAAIAAIVAMMLPAQKPSDKTQTSTVDFSTDGMTAGGLTGDRYSEDNAKTATNIATALQDLANKIGESYGFTAGGRMLVAAGSRDGLVLQHGAAGYRFSNDEAGVSGLLKKATSLILEENAPALSKDLATTYATVGASDPDKLIAALDWTSTVYKELNKTSEELAGSTNQFAEAMKALRTPFDEVIAKAKEFGLATETIAERQKEATDKLVKERDQTLQDIFTSISDRVLVATGGDTFDRQMQVYYRQQDAQRRAMEEQVRQLGAGANVVQDVLRAMVGAMEAEAEAMKRQYEGALLTQERDALRGLSSQGNVLTTFLNREALTDASPQQQFLAAQETYRAALERASQAEAHNADLGSVTSAASELLKATGSFYGEGAEAALIRTGVTNQVRALGADLGLPGFSDSAKVEQTLNRWIEVSTDSTAALEGLRDEVNQLREEMRLQRIDRVDDRAVRSDDEYLRPRAAA